MIDREAIIRCIAAMAPYPLAVRLIFYLENGYFPRLQKPVTFNEKICRVKMKPPPIISRLVDKLQLRQYVGSLLSSDFLPELYFSAKSIRRSDYLSLPESYVFKANHGWGFNRVVTPVSPATYEELDGLSSIWLTTNYSRSRNLELQYEGVEKRVFAEEYVGVNSLEANDYKIHVFRSSPNTVTDYVFELHFDRSSDHKIQFVDRNWNSLDLGVAGGRPVNNIPPPPTLGKMLHAAELLSRPFPYSRIDMYSFHNRALVGEITFTPSGGHEKFTPPDVDREWGEKISCLDGCFPGFDK